MVALERTGDGWRLLLKGDWSLAAMARIEGELATLTTPFDGALVCDWSQAEAPGIGPVWAVLHRLADLNAGGHAITHLGEPHTLEFLRKLRGERLPREAFRAAADSAGAIGNVTERLQYFGRGGRARDGHHVVVWPLGRL